MWEGLLPEFLPYSTPEDPHRERVYERKECGKPFSRKHTSLSTRRSTLGTGRQVQGLPGKPLFRLKLLLPRLFTLERGNPMCSYCGEGFIQEVKLPSAPEDPLRRNSTSVVSMGKGSPPDFNSESGAPQGGPSLESDNRTLGGDV